jgi:hypothetical protein
VKVIDVWPAEYPNDPKMGGYQQMISADILRGRFREDFSTAEADRAEPGARVPDPPAAGEPRIPARAPDHGADPVELVPALRPQSADLRAEHHVRPARELREGDAAHLADFLAALRGRAAGHS